MLLMILCVELLFEWQMAHYRARKTGKAPARSSETKRTNPVNRGVKKPVTKAPPGKRSFTDHTNTKTCLVLL